MVFPEIKGRFAFGCMRLPMKGEDVDIEQFKQMVDIYLDAGFNYFDTAHGYLSGKSETALAEALVARYSRDKYLFTNKLSNPFFNSQEDIIPLFNKQLEWCGGLDYFDFYLMHCQESSNYDKYKQCRAYETAFELKKQGKIRHVGISFHDKVELLEKILNDYPQIEFVQIQFNYLDCGSDDVQSDQLYDLCTKYEKPVFVMEPVKGGKLAIPPAKVKKLYDELNREKGNNYSYASYALRFALGFDNNRLILSGVSDIAQTKENCELMNNYVPLDSDENNAIKEAKPEFEKLKSIDCTGCSYCISEGGCPQKINIPMIFSCYNDKKIFKDWNAKEFYNSVIVPNSGDISSCLKCGKCAKACPQHLDIPFLLEQFTKELL